MTTIRRLTSTVVVLAVLLTLTAVPALAAPIATATISDILYSGQDANVTVRITNAGSPASGVPGVVGNAADDPIDSLVIEIPAAVIQLNGTQPVTVAAWPNGSAYYDDEVGMVFAFAGEGEELVPGASMDVVLSGTATAVADDTTRNVPVHVSSDGGITAHPVAQTPQLTSKILQITSVTPRKPGTATNPDPLQLTAGQDTAQVVVEVRNHGTQDRLVTVDADGARLDTTAADVTIASGTTVPVALDTLVGTVGTTRADATAVAGPSAALDVSSAVITVQQAFDATYVVDSLEPRNARQGESIAFSLSTNKVGAQPAAIEATMTFAGVGAAAFGPQTSVSYPAGNGQTGLAFPATTIPDVANGDYLPSVTLTGVDANGATVDDLLDLDVVTITNLLPYVVDFVATVPPSQVAGRTAAATSGDTVTFSGRITEGSSAADSQTCTECVVDAAYVETLAGERIGDITISNDGGQLTGAATLDYADGTTAVRAVVEVTSPSLVSGGATTTYDVDVIVPTIGGTLVDQDGSTCTPCVELTQEGDTFVITVPASELVNATGVRPAHFSVDDATVVEVQSSPAADGADTLRLVLDGPVDAQDEGVVVLYSPGGNGLPSLNPGSRMVDRVGLGVADTILEVVDGIAPEVPVVTLVDDLAKQDDAFWTNTQPSTTITVEARIGELLTLFFDQNGNGVEDEGERLFAGDVVSSPMTVDVDAALLPNVNTDGTLVGQLFDGRLVGPLSTDAFNVDVTAPVLESFVATGNTVTVSFDEPIRSGARHAAFDWAVFAVQTGEAAYRTVTSVTPQGNDSVVLEVSTASYDPALGPITGVRFKYRGAAPDLFVDRALNPTGTNQAVGDRP